MTAHELTYRTGVVLHAQEGEAAWQDNGEGGQHARYGGRNYDVQEGRFQHHYGGNPVWIASIGMVAMLC